MTKFKVLELKNFVEFNVPFMFETPAAIEKKVDLNKIISVNITTYFSFYHNRIFQVELMIYLSI